MTPCLRALSGQLFHGLPGTGLELDAQPAVALVVAVERLRHHRVSEGKELRVQAPESVLPAASLSLSR